MQFVGVKHRLVMSGAALLISGNVASAQRLAFTSGWDNFNEPLDYKKSYVVYSINQASHQLKVAYSLHGATPTKLYQAALAIFNACPNPPGFFGNFGEDSTYGCDRYTRQGVEATTTSVEFGAILTDLKGNGITTVVINNIASGLYKLEFVVRDGAGCGVSGGAGNGNDCYVDFQSPGPIFADTVAITIP